eukprot:14245891-Alexandrium_andersonii.AAC.1
MGARGFLGPSLQRAAAVGWALMGWHPLVGQPGRQCGCILRPAAPFPLAGGASLWCLARSGPPRRGH